MRISAIACALAAGLAPHLSAQPSTTAREFTVEPDACLSGIRVENLGRRQSQCESRGRLPEGPQRVYHPDGYDFRLKPGSVAVDAGVVLPTITDGFTGRARDLGAHEVDRPVFHVGPR